MAVLTRLQMANLLKRMAVSYFCHLRFGVFQEVGIQRWGKRRADVIAMSLKGEIVICEVKSCLADFRSDTKYLEYLPACNRFYFIFPHALDVELPPEIGIMVPGANGYLRVIRPARRRTMVGSVKREIITRLAWRAATFSKRNHPRRIRLYTENK